MQLRRRLSTNKAPRIGGKSKQIHPMNKKKNGKGIAGMYRRKKAKV
jgi:hypothetical protein